MRQAFRSCDFALVNPTSESFDGFRYDIHLRLFAMPASSLPSGVCFQRFQLAGQAARYLKNAANPADLLCGLFGFSLPTRLALNGDEGL